MTRSVLLLVVGALVTGVLVALAGASAVAATSSSTYDFLLTYSGSLQDAYANSFGSTDVVLKYSESRRVEVKFLSSGAGSAIVQEGAVTLTASGTIDTSTGDDCTISAGGTENVDDLVQSGSTTNGHGKKQLIIQAQAEAPVNIGTDGPLVVTGSNSDCAADTNDGSVVAPYDFLNPPLDGFQHEAQLESGEQANVTNLAVSTLPFSRSTPEHWAETDSTGGTDQVMLTNLFTITAVCGAAASGSGPSCSSPCPNPEDDPLPGEAEKRADDIVQDEFDGVGFRADGLAEAALFEMRATGKHVRRDFPDDRAERKRLINEKYVTIRDRLDRLDETTKHDLDVAETRDIAHAKCAEVKQKIHEIYTARLARLDEDYKIDVKFCANEVIATVNGFCGCHL